MRIKNAPEQPIPRSFLTMFHLFPAYFSSFTADTSDVSASFLLFFNSRKLPDCSDSTKQVLEFLK